MTHVNPASHHHSGGLFHSWDCQTVHCRQKFSCQSFDSLAPLRRPATLSQDLGRTRTRLCSAWPTSSTPAGLSRCI